MTQHADCRAYTYLTGLLSVKFGVNIKKIAILFNSKRLNKAVS